MESMEIVRVEGDSFSRVTEKLSEEVPLTIEVNGTEAVTLLCSPDHMEDLVKGSIQGVVADSPVAVEYTTKKHADKIKIAATLKSDTVENIGIAVKKGNKEVLDLVNKGLAAIKADGTFAKIQEAHKMK